MLYIALCHTCRHQHKIDFDPKRGPGNQLNDWYVKHPHPHVTEFRFPQRRQRDGHSRPKPVWREYIENANVKTAYAASAVVETTGFNSLAASAALLAGYETIAQTNASNLYLDYLAAGNYQAGSANNQAGSIYTCVVGARDDTPNWPDVFDGTASAETVTDSGTFNAICKVLSAIGADNTASQIWYWGPNSVAALFGGVLPVQFVYFVTHNIHTSTNVWNTSGHDLSHTGVYATVA